MADEKEQPTKQTPPEAAAPAKGEGKKAEKKKEKEKAPVEKKAGPKKGDYGPDFKYIVRIANADLDGTKKTELALTGIRGVGSRMGTLICDAAGVPRTEKIGNLSEQQIESLVKTVDDVAEHVPPWAVNRPNDVESGGDLHLVSSNVDVFLRDDLNRLKKIRSYRGLRHENGQKVRGQRSKSNGRTGLTLGVTRQKAAAGAGEAKKEESK